MPKARAHGLWLTYLSRNQEIMTAAWKQLFQWIAEEHLRPVIGHIFPLGRAVDAYRLLLDRKNFGKVVLRVM